MACPTDTEKLSVSKFTQQSLQNEMLDLTEIINDLVDLRTKIHWHDSQHEKDSTTL